MSSTDLTLKEKLSVLWSVSAWYEKMIVCLGAVLLAALLILVGFVLWLKPAILIAVLGVFILVGGSLGLVYAGEMFGNWYSPYNFAIREYKASKKKRNLNEVAKKV